LTRLGLFSPTLGERGDGMANACVALLGRRDRLRLRRDDNSVTRGTPPQTRGKGEKLHENLDGADRLC